jgi:flagellar hook protein FlgE
MALTALFTGSTGLLTFSRALDVVGNNLANLNTTAYKVQRTLFKDIFYQTLNPGSAPSGTFGGTNPSQLGFGSALGVIDSVFLQGSINPTGRTLDAAIQGKGFFVVTDGTSTFYTRAGSFTVDAAGFLVDFVTGFRVQRTGTVGEPQPGQPGFQTPGVLDIRVPFGAGLSGVPTANVVLQGNLSSTLNVGDSISTAIQIYDSQSTLRALTITFTKTAVNQFQASATVTGGTATIPPTPIVFDTAGLLVSPATLTVNISGIPGAAAQNIVLNLGTPGTSSGLTQFGGPSTAAAVTQDGFASGTLISVSFNQNGELVGQFSNGRTQPLAQLAIAGFNNESGLLRSGNNYYAASPSSGEAVIGAAGTGGLGLVQGSALEGSNVDIATEFARLIIAQRGFQVNARSITAANETLQELANLIR